MTKTAVVFCLNRMKSKPARQNLLQLKSASRNLSRRYYLRRPAVGDADEDSNTLTADIGVVHAAARPENQVRVDRKLNERFSELRGLIRRYLLEVARKPAAGFSVFFPPSLWLWASTARKTATIGKLAHFKGSHAMTADTLAAPVATTRVGGVCVRQPGRCGGRRSSGGEIGEWTA